jgi:hypothetical protein
MTETWGHGKESERGKDDDSDEQTSIEKAPDPSEDVERDTIALGNRANQGLQDSVLEERIFEFNPTVFHRGEDNV